MEHLTLNNNIAQVNDIQKNVMINPPVNTKEDVYSHNTNSPIITQSSNMSDFGSNITMQINKITDLQTAQSIISNQIEITTEVVQTIDYGRNSPLLDIDDKQPQIKSLLDNFNHLSEGLTKLEISDEIGIFFDGILGSKPLDTTDIYNEMQIKKDKLSFFQKEINSEIQAISINTHKTIEAEKSNTETRVSFKNNNHSQENTLFNQSQISNVQGELIHSQANASPLYTQTLLS